MKSSSKRFGKRNNVRSNSLFNFVVLIIFLFSSQYCSDPAGPVDPGISDDSRGIAYVSDWQGNFEIYTIKEDGSGLQRITNNTFFDSGPYWSPDGRKILFMSTRDGNFEVYIMNADGSNQQRLTNNPGFDGFPTWSPDGSKIGFSSDRNGNSDVYVMDVTNYQAANISDMVFGEIHQITTNLAEDYRCAWSPDGSKIAFESDRDNDIEIYIMNSDGSNQERMTTIHGDDQNPSWSPDGNFIAFNSMRNSSTAFDILKVNVSDKSITEITNFAGQEEEPVWSPDGTKILYSTQRSLNIIDSDGSNSRRLTEVKFLTAGGVWCQAPIM